MVIGKEESQSHLPLPKILGPNALNSATTLYSWDGVKDNVESLEIYGSNTGTSTARRANQHL